MRLVPANPEEPRRQSFIYRPAFGSTSSVLMPRPLCTAGLSCEHRNPVERTPDARALRRSERQRLARPCSPRIGPNVVVPMSREMGASGGYWLAPFDGRGVSVVVFDTEDAARIVAERFEVGQPPGADARGSHGPARRGARGTRLALGAPRPPRLLVVADKRPLSSGAVRGVARPIVSMRRVRKHFGARKCVAADIA
jgi:hypothetical protein